MGRRIIEHLEEISSALDALKNSEDLISLDQNSLGQFATLIRDRPGLLQILENAGKTSKLIRETCGLNDWDEDDKGSKVQDKTGESFHENLVEPPKERKRFRVMMDASNFLPNKVDVKVLGKYLVIHGKHGIWLDEHGVISREFTRKFEIPEDVDIDSFTALIDCYSVLTVEASYKSMNVKGKTIDMLDNSGKISLQSCEDFGQGFQESAKHQIQDVLEMTEIAKNLAKRLPSGHIPL